MRFSELEGKRIGVWGAGREISSFARQLALRLPAARIAVAVFDREPNASERAALPDGVRIEAAGAAAAALSECDVVVRSPGVSIHRPELAALAVPVTTATSLWLAEHGSERVLGVSGTKGKSTTAALAAALARAVGVRVALAGNIGVPALELLDDEAAELVVLELSSYQVADLEHGPEVALMLNLFREHSDWHGSDEAYRADKLRLLSLPGVRVALVNGAQQDLRERAAAIAGARLELFGAGGRWRADAAGVWRDGELVLAAERVPLRGEHNALNLCAALAALEQLGVPAPPLPDALAGFEPLPHRLQQVAATDGVAWVDDSISTTPESALAAIASFAGEGIVLIAGGQDRGQDYDALARELARRRASVVGIPSTGPRLIAAARSAGVERALEAPDLAAAVRAAHALARERGRSGDVVVLLSPAAPSYDHFRDFEERGERFAELARRAR